VTESGSIVGRPRDAAVVGGDRVIRGHLQPPPARRAFEPLQRGGLGPRRLLQQPADILGHALVGERLSVRTAVQDRRRQCCQLLCVRTAEVHLGDEIRVSPIAQRMDVRAVPEGSRRDPEVEDRGSQGHEEHPPERILGRQLALAIAVDLDHPAPEPEPEPPWLRIVHGRSRNHQPDQLLPISVRHRQERHQSSSGNLRPERDTTSPTPAGTSAPRPQDLRLVGIYSPVSSPRAITSHRG
jgi:hypothetical protein